jgi:hypothetical protein
VDNNRIPVPPGRLIEVKAEGEVVRLRLEEGEIAISRYPVGFVSALFEERGRSVGMRPVDQVCDASVLEAVAKESLQEYRFGWSEDQRQPYAARLLSKMALWDLRPVKRFEMTRGEGACAVLVEYESGEVRVFAAHPGGSMAAVIPAGVPAAWKATPASWLEPDSMGASPSQEAKEAR